MILDLCALAALLVFSPSTPPDSHACYETNIGWASYYNPSPMKATIRVRQEMQQIPSDISPWDGFAATLDCKYVGDTVWVRRPNMGQFRPYLVVDCAVRDDSDGTISWMSENNILLEFDHRSYQDFPDGRIEVVFDGPTFNNGEDNYYDRISLSENRTRLASRGSAATTRSVGQVAGHGSVVE